MHSIVIPSYNSANGLRLTLESLTAQQAVAATELEVIVVDDGSDDETLACVRDFHSRLAGLYTVFSPRTPLSCRARARNLGAQQAHGTLLSFVDAGVVVAPSFVRRVQDHREQRDNTVRLHLTYGLFADPESPGVENLQGLTPFTFESVIARLAADPAWADPRQGLFELVDDRLDELPAPWALGWTCAMTVPRLLFEQLGGFDESFVEWGDEDVDLSYRLSLHGASFVSDRQAVALHFPHPKVPAALREVGRLARRRKIHRRRPQPATELFIALQDIWSLQQALWRLETLVLAYTGVRYRPELLRAVKHHLSAGPVLLVGADCSATVAQVGATHVAAHSTRAAAILADSCPGVRVFHSFCVDTGFADRQFPVALLTDYIRVLPPSLRREIFRELRRIAERIVVIYTQKYWGRVSEVDGSSLAQRDAVLASAQEAGVALTVAVQLPDCVLLDSGRTEPAS